jgi:rhodanese-related sulfurtransferase
MNIITVQELKYRIDKGDNLRILDVREPSEYAEFNIGGQLLPLGQIANMQVDSIEDFKDEELIIHCRAGSRSMQACMILEQLGFKNVVNVTGGMLAWQQMIQQAQ